ncbi:hypothetical protein ABZP36_007324 [Zizania latifolia]
METWTMEKINKYVLLQRHQFPNFSPKYISLTEKGFSFPTSPLISPEHANLEKDNPANASTRYNGYLSSFQHRANKNQQIITRTPSGMCANCLELIAEGVKSGGKNRNLGGS